MRVIDHDGIAEDGSAHTVIVTYPDSTTRMLDFEYKESETTCVYSFWDNNNPIDDAGVYSGEYVYRITDNIMAEWSEMMDQVSVDACRFKTGESCTGDFENENDIDGKNLADFARQFSEGTAQISIEVFASLFGS